MKKNVKIWGALLIVPAAFLGSCKKDIDVNILSTGNFAETGAALKDAADFPVGVAINYGPMTNEPPFAASVKRDFDQVVFGYEMKHGAIVQNNGNFNYANADAMVAAVGAMDVFGHTLGWHQNQNATYLKSFAGITLPSAIESLANPGFESGGAALGNWSTFNAQNGSTVTVTTVASEVRSGTRAMKVVAAVGEPANQWKVQVASDLFNTVVGTQYTANYFVKAGSGTGSIRLSTQTSGGGSAQYQGDQAISSSAFSLVSWTFTANSPQTRLVFDMGAAVNTYFIDDASVKEVIPASTGGQIATKLDQALNTFITNMVTRYKAKVHAWDVINELFTDDGNIRTNGNTVNTAADVLVWSNYLGRDYALKAFNYAKAADPTADLYINDYNLESSAVKLDSLIKFVAELKTKGAKVDGIGTQMHITRNTSYAGIDAMMQKLAATGLKIRVSELDVRMILGSAAGKPTPQLLAYQAVMYKYVVTSYMKNIPKPQQAGITVWGVNDKNSWLYNNGAEYPLLYDNDYNKKPAYAGFLQGLKGQ